MSDYIKRDELLKIRPFTCYMVLSVCQYDEYDEGFLDCAEAAREAIKNLPAADVAEVKHGQWQLDEAASCGHIEYIYTCSACRNCTVWGETEKTRYCPNCGALMEQEM